MRFSLSKVFWNLSKVVQEIWFRGSDPTDDFEGVLVSPGGTMERVLLGNPRSCH